MGAPAPQFIPEAFANLAAGSYRNTIPDTTVDTQRASFALGFPPETMTPVVSGGKPMLGPDMNGILYMLSSHAVYAQSGEPYHYDATIAAAIGGYAKGTLLGSTDGTTLWYNNTAGNSTDPDLSGAGWIALYSYGISSIATTGGVRTLSLVEAAKNVIVITGALVTNSQIVLPTQIRRWLIVNATSGAYTLTVKTAAGAGVIVPQSGYTGPVEVWCDGTSIYNVVAPVTLPIDQNATPLTIAQRTNAGYLLATYFNQSSAVESFAVSSVIATQGDGYFRKISPANFAAQFSLSAFTGQVTNSQVPVTAVTQYKANVLDNPTLTGVAQAPTVATGDNSTNIATTAYVQGTGLGGAGQTYYNMAASRFEGVIYTNTTGRPIQVIIAANMGFPAATYIYVNGLLVGNGGNGGSNSTHTFTFIVPAGATYQMVHSGGAFFSFTWFELR